MSKSLSELSKQEFDTILDNVAAVYEKHGHPEWLPKPTVYTEVVNVLNAGIQQKQQVFQVEGTTTVDKKDLAKQIADEIKAATAVIKQKQIKISAEVGVGSAMAPMVDATNYKGETATVKHEAGQVMLLDFWATWCPPCQRPMAHNQEMLNKRGADWGDKVRILGLSIDDSLDAVKGKVEEKQWTSVEHWHVSNGKCTADQEYGISGVPCVALIDKQGQIVFKGHPSERKNLEEDIDTLLKGEKISVKESKDDEPKAAEELSGKDLTEEIEKFTNDSKAMLDSVKQKA